MEENKSLADANSVVIPEKKEEVPDKSAAAPAAVQTKPQDNSSDQIKKTQEMDKVQPKTQNISGNEQHKVKKRRFHLYHVKNALKKAHPMNIKAKLGHYRFEYSRILHLARKPTKQEFKELSIMVIIGTFIIGTLGFIIQMIIQYI